MQVDIYHRPSASLAVLYLEAGESACAEQGAVVSLSRGVQIETGGVGLGKGLKRVLADEQFSINTFKAESAAEVTVAPAIPGDVVHHRLGGETLYLRSGAYVASSSDVEVESKWGGATGMFSDQGLILLKVSGSGDLLFSSFGALHELDIPAGQSYLVGTGHLVAISDGTRYDVCRVDKRKPSLLGDEDLVAELVGPGMAYLQSRSPERCVSF